MAGSMVQQGSFDWFALSKNSVSSSLEVLSRFSKAGVEIMTVVVGQALFQTFNFPADGQMRLQDAISKLKAFSSYGEIIWFGFGVKHIIRTLVETEQGACCATICACLSVPYDAEFSAQVLRALCAKSSAPNSLTPALSQWVALVRVCAGAVTHSRFPNLVEGFVLLLSRSPSQIALQHATSPTVLAGALVEIGNVSNGSLRSVTFIGGLDCAWLAALSEWMFSLRVEIMDPNGTCVYKSRPNTKHELYPQVVIVRQESSTKENLYTTVYGKTYVVTPGALVVKSSVGEIILDPAQMFFHGRSGWSNILHNTFANSITKLLEPSTVEYFAGLLCSTAMAVTPDEHRERKAVLNPWGGSKFLCNAQVEQRLCLNFAADRFPELAGLSRIASTNLYLDSAGIDYSDQSEGAAQAWSRWFLNKLGCKCPCRNCAHGHGAIDGTLCIVRVARTIIKALMILSWLDVDEAIKPSGCGLMLLYQNIHSTPDFGAESLPSSPWRNHVTALFCASSRALELRFMSSSTSAFSSGGVCFYFQSLDDPTTSPSHQLRMRVVPGQIEHDGRVYTEIRDMQPDLGPHQIDGRHFVEEAIRMFGTNPSFQLIIEETFSSSSLNAAFIAVTKGQPMASVKTGPYMLRHLLLKSFEHTSCYAGPVKMSSLWHQSSMTDRVSESCCSEGGGWTLFSKYIGEELNRNPLKVQAQVLNGPYTLYYCIVAKAAEIWSSDVRVVYPGLTDTHQCLTCLLSRDPESTLGHDYKLEPEIQVHSIDDGKATVVTPTTFNLEESMQSHVAAKKSGLVDGDYTKRTGIGVPADYNSEDSDFDSENN